MFQTAGYPAHPSYFDYRSPPRTPTATPRSQQYYSPRHFSYVATPPKVGHARRATADYVYTTTTTASPSYATFRKTAYYAPPEYVSPAAGYASAQTTSQRKPDYVPIYTSAGNGNTNNETKSSRPRRASHAAAKPSTPQHHPDRDSSYQQRSSAPPPRRPATSRDQRFSSSSREYFSTPNPQKQPPPAATSTAAPAEATPADARRAGIPAGYSTKNWDPTEEPILLLGSVFDANSLGKWIYDWTVYYFGAGTPLSEVAGELWLLLIQLAGKIKRAEECLGRIRRVEKRELVEDFLESGERLWMRFSKLLKICEGFMWRVARKENAGKGGGGEKLEGEEAKVKMGRSSGCEFVDAIFGIDREMPRTEKLMTGMRLWSMRFDANCEDVLRDPSR